MQNSVFYPKVSIIIPVYNGGNYLKNAIDCALAQTYKNLEIIVVDDGSNDGGITERIARAYGTAITYYSKSNGGVSSALNYGIDHMTGTYFSWLSHDDAYSPTKVADSVELLRKLDALDEKTIAYTGGSHIDESGKELRRIPTKLTENKVYSGEEMVRYCVSHKTLNGCCMLIPKAALLSCGGFDENLRYSQDSLMWYKLFFFDCRLVYDGKNNVGYRLHSAQTSQTRHDLFEHDAGIIAAELAPHFLKICGGKNELLFSYAMRMAKYRCYHVVEQLSVYAADRCPLSAGQKWKLKIISLYGSYRGKIKQLYYRRVLKVKI